MTSKSKEFDVKKFIEKWRGKIGLEWVASECTIEEIMSSAPIFIEGWNAEVTWDAIKKYAIVNMDLNALWLDEEYASKSRWAGIIAPPVFLQSVDSGLRPIDPVSVEGRGTGLYQQGFNAAFEWEFFEAVRPGDKITTKGKLADLVEKQGQRGKLLLTTAETDYYNQKGQHVATNRETVILVRDSKVGSYGSADKDVYGPFLPHFDDLPSGMTGEFVKGGVNIAGRMKVKDLKGIRREQVFFEDVAVGSEIPPLKKTLFWQAQQAAFGSSIGIWCPSFFSEYYSKEMANFSSCVVAGAQMQPLLCQFLTAWVGT